MNWHPYIKGLWLFNNNLEDSVKYTDTFYEENSDFITESDVSYKTFLKYNHSVRDVVATTGLKFESNKTLIAKMPWKIPASGPLELCISFWWYSPKIIGYTKHVINNQIEPYVAPIISVGNVLQILPSGQVESYQCQFSIEETAHSIKSNKMAFRVFELHDRVQSNGSVYSEPYEPGLHHFSIHYIRSSSQSIPSTARIDLDGNPSPWYKINQGFMWANSYITSRSPILLNTYIGNNYIQHVKYQEDGILSELMIFNKSFENLFSVKAVRFGWEYVAKQSQSSMWIEELSTSFNQPSTVDTNFIMSEGQTIYIARSDGSLLKGEKAIWDYENIYPNSEMTKLLNISKKGQEDSPKWTPEGLYINGGLVRV